MSVWVVYVVQVLCGNHKGRSVYVAIPASLQDIVNHTSIPLSHQATNHEDV